MPILRVKLPDSGEVTHVLTGGRISLGRRPDNTIQLLDRSISGHHAELIEEDGHYRLHDLGSTNLTFVDGEPVIDFHLHGSCRLRLGNIECEYDAMADPRHAAEPKLTFIQMEKDMAFLRAENQELINKMDGLQRRIDILSSARLVTGKADAGSANASDLLKRVSDERDELRFHNSGLRLELEKLREEVAIAGRERDTARQANDLMHAEKAIHFRERDAAPRVAEAGTTQRITFPSPQATQIITTTLPDTEESGLEPERQAAGAG